MTFEFWYLNAVNAPRIEIRENHEENPIFQQDGTRAIMHYFVRQFPVDTFHVIFNFYVNFSCYVLRKTKIFWSDFFFTFKAGNLSGPFSVGKPIWIKICGIYIGHEGHWYVNTFNKKENFFWITNLFKTCPYSFLILFNYRRVSLIFDFVI